jgi:GGDEF domain-containing protein
MFSQKKRSDNEQEELASSLSRMVQVLLQACALHAVDFDSQEHADYRSSIRELESRFEQASDSQALLILAGEAKTVIQAYNQSMEKFIRSLSIEKQQAISLLSDSLVRICHSSEKSQSLRRLEATLAKASDLDQMRVIRGEMKECLESLCHEAAARDAQFLELKERSLQPAAQLAPPDPVTGLSIIGHAQARISELIESGQPGVVITFFLKNVDVVNRRFGFSSGDEVLRKFGSYLTENFKGREEVFRWRGPCFVVVGPNFRSLEAVKSDASTLALRAPELELEHDGKSMLFRLTAATAAYPTSKSQDVSGLSAAIDQFAAAQYKATQPRR